MLRPIRKLALTFAVSAALAAFVVRTPSLAQQQPQTEGDLLKRLDTTMDTAGDASPAPAGKAPDAKKGKDADQKAPTEITATKEATYEEKTRKAVFIGDVRVKDAQINITCEKLTAFLRREATDAGGGGAPSPGPKASPAAKASASPGAANAPKDNSRSSGLERAIAEGTRENPVIIIQDKPATDGGKPQHNIGKAERADYDANTGDVTLTGWPQVSQGINTQVATSAETIMIMNRDGKTMKTKGPSKTLIQEQSGDDSKTSQR